MIVSEIMNSTPLILILNTVPKYPGVNWSDIEVCASYSRYFMDCAKSLPTINFDGVQSHDEAHQVVDSMCGDVVAVMYEAGYKVISDKQCSYRGRFKPIRIVWLLGIGRGLGSEYGKTVIDFGRVTSIYVISRRKGSIDQPVF